jgi:hypothetical protein
MTMTIIRRAKRVFGEHCRIVDARADGDAELADLLIRRRGGPQGHGRKV